MVKFQSTPLREGRQWEPSRTATGIRVSIHAPARGATRGESIMAKTKSSFNPRPCARGDYRIHHVVGTRHVSIHAPARGATSERFYARCRENVSIHAPARGATARLLRKRSITISFNPRPCARGDAGEDIDVYRGTKFQSTPLREGRLPHHISFCISALFQSTPLREGRLIRMLITSTASLFQSTPLREGRPGYTPGDLPI